jgi:hypothetical protein
VFGGSAVHEKLLEVIRKHVAHKVAEGFASEDDSVEWTLDSLYEHEPEELRPYVRRITAELLEEHRRAQDHWPSPTDCDKLDSAFAELEGEGILARQHYWCCSTCGHAAAWEEVKQARTEREVKGYVLYHEQDTEGAVYGSFFLAYGAAEDSDEAMIGVANTIIETLGRFGIKTEWNGQTDSRILVKEFDWKRRRTFDLPA